jgi:hypothetical protein
LPSIPNQEINQDDLYGPPSNGRLHVGFELYQVLLETPAPEFNSRKLMGTPRIVRSSRSYAGLRMAKTAFLKANRVLSQRQCFTTASRSATVTGKGSTRIFPIAGRHLAYRGNAMQLPPR